MFDDHRIDIRHPEKIIHEEKRATSDSSIQLCKEFEEKILKSILEKLLVKDNFFEYTVCITSDNFLSRNIHINISINGNLFLKTFTANYNLDKMIETIIQWFSEIFLKDILSGICQCYLSGNSMGYGTYTISNKEENNASNTL